MLLPMQSMTASGTIISCKGSHIHAQQPAEWQYLGEADGLDGLSDAANLVDLQQQRGARLLLDGALDASRVGAQEIITNHLHAKIHVVSPCRCLELYSSDGAAHLLTQELQTLVTPWLILCMSVAVLIVALARAGGTDLAVH